MDQGDGWDDKVLVVPESDNLSRAQLMSNDFWSAAAKADCFSDITSCAARSRKTVRPGGKAGIHLVQPFIVA